MRLSLNFKVLLLFSVTVEEFEKFSGILLHVEDNRSIRTTEANQGCRSRNQTEASVHS